MSGTGRHTVGFVLHARPFRDGSRVVELLTESEGRTACLFRGRGGACRTFVRYELAWRGRGELKTLSVAEEQTVFNLPPARLVCGFYVNELAVKLLPRHIPLDGLVDAYGRVLAELEDVSMPVEPSLRLYELHLLHHLGEALDSLDTDTLKPEDRYVYESLRGLRPAGPAERARGDCVHGETLLALLADHPVSGRTQQEARRLLRGLLDSHLHGKRIVSRTLLRPQRSADTAHHGNEPNDEP